MRKSTLWAALYAGYLVLIIVMAIGAPLLHPEWPTSVVDGFHFNLGRLAGFGFCIAAGGFIGLRLRGL
jgi:hypothetical protein